MPVGGMVRGTYLLVLGQAAPSVHPHALILDTAANLNLSFLREWSLP